MKLNVIECDSKKAILSVATGKKVNIKLNRHWDDHTKAEVQETLTKVAEHVLTRNLGYTVKGQYSPDHPHMIQLKSNHKVSPKKINVYMSEMDGL